MSCFESERIIKNTSFFGHMNKELCALYKERKDVILQRLQDFKKVKKEALFYELCFCLLTPQSNGKLCWSKVLRLKEQNFHDQAIDPSSLIYPIRFYKNKSRYLLEMKQHYSIILEKLQGGEESSQLREWLVKEVKGLGYKESSHFLRNIGHTHLAILDRHILRNLQAVGAIKRLPKTLTRKRYLRIEKKFLNYADKVGIPLDELDLLFWSKETGEVFK